MTVAYYTLMMEGDIRKEAELMAFEAMPESQCGDCKSGGPCMSDVMQKYCDGWKKEYEEALEEVRRLVVEEKAAIAVGAPGPHEEGR